MTGADEAARVALAQAGGATTREVKGMTTDVPLKAPVVWRGQLLQGYCATADGQIWSEWQRAEGCVIRWERGSEVRPLKPTRTGRDGKYRGVALRSAGRTIRASVHRLIAEAFLGPCPVGMEVCHKDGSGHNNSLDNLRYGTKTSNEADKRQHGTHQDGERNPSAKLTDEQVVEIRILRGGGVGLKEIAERFGVSESTVSRIANGVRRAR